MALAILAPTVRLIPFEVSEEQANSRHETVLGLEQRTRWLRKPGSYSILEYIDHVLKGRVIKLLIFKMWANHEAT